MRARVAHTIICIYILFNEMIINASNRVRIEFISSDFLMRSFYVIYVDKRNTDDRNTNQF